jgi:hypothetical protein
MVFTVSDLFVQLSWDATSEPVSIEIEGIDRLTNREEAA